MALPLGGLFKPVHRAEQPRTLAGAQAALDGETFVAAWAEGRTMTLEQTIDYALNKDGRAPAPPNVERSPGQ